jgi:hypothetical protein
VVECARLESVYAARYQGFESLTLRKIEIARLLLGDFNFVRDEKGAG